MISRNKKIDYNVYGWKMCSRIMIKYSGYIVGLRVSHFIPFDYSKANRYNFAITVCNNN